MRLARRRLVRRLGLLRLRRWPRLLRRPRRPQRRAGLSRRTAALPYHSPQSQGGLVWTAACSSPWARGVVVQLVSPEHKGRAWHAYAHTEKGRGRLLSRRAGLVASAQAALSDHDERLAACGEPALACAGGARLCQRLWRARPQGRRAGCRRRHWPAAEPADEGAAVLQPQQAAHCNAAAAPLHGQRWGRGATLLEPLTKARRAAVLAASARCRDVAAAVHAWLLARRGVVSCGGLAAQMNPYVSHLSLYDVVGTPGVAADVSHINSKAQVKVRRPPWSHASCPAAVVLCSVPTQQMKQVVPEMSQGCCHRA